MKKVLAFLLLLIPSASIFGHPDVPKNQPVKPVQEGAYMLRLSGLEEKTVSFTRLIDSLQSCPFRLGEKMAVTIFRDVKIRFESAVDKGPGGMDSMYFNPPKQPRNFPGSVKLANCDFDEEFWFVLNNVEIENLTILNCTHVKMLFKNCRFKGPIRLNDNEIEFIQFDSCRFESGFKANRNTIGESIAFNHSTFEFRQGREVYGLDMNDKIFEFKNNKDGDLILEGDSFHASGRLQGGNQSKAAPENSFVDLSNSKFEDLLIRNCRTDGPLVFNRTLIQSQFSLYNTETPFLLFEGVSLNPDNSQIEWNKIMDRKIAVWDSKNKVIVNGDNRKALFADPTLQANLMAAYSTLYGTYKKQDNKQFANLIYREWKDIVTADALFAWHHERDGKKRFNAFGDYLLWRFFGIFCKYGTSPLRAILCCLLVILTFGLIYSLFPDSIALDEHRKIRMRLTLYLNFASSREKNFRIYLQNLQIPSVGNAVLPQGSNKLIRWIGRVRYNVEHRIYQLHRRYSWRPDAGSRHKVLSGRPYRMTFWMVCGFNYGLLILLRYWNRLFLSMNVFTTLGFGELKVSGAAIYLTVLEGFIGWFLLGLFSVTLLNQIIT